MPKVSPLQSSFTSGEFSPLLYGRVDAERYAQALSTCLNYVPTTQGGLIRRSGSYYVANTKTMTEASRLVPFEFSITQAYVLEFGKQYIRFFLENGQLESSPGVPYEISTPYAEADLFQLKFAQSADVLYITHPSYAPRKLTRLGATNWTLTAITFLDGPYLPLNTTTVQLIPSAATGTGVTLRTGSSRTITNAANNGSGKIRITSAGHLFSTGDAVFIEGVTGTTEANGNWTITVIDANNFDLVGSTFVNAYVAGGTVRPSLFASTDVGRVIRMLEGSAWGWARIASYVNQSNVTIDIQSTLTSTSAKTNWRLGLWSDTTGYPSCVTFFEDRLLFSGATAAPQRLDGSKTADYENFAPTATNGTVADDNAISFSFNANDVNVTRWIAPDEKALLAGTVAGEWSVKASSLGEAITPTNVTAKPATAYGSADIQPARVGRSTMFVTRSGRKLREMNFFFDVDGYQSPDLTLLSQHITGAGILQLAYQKEPQSILWCVRSDGVLVGMTYERELQELKVGWHRHILGGQSDSAGSPAVVESAAAIPSPDGTRNELWVIVRRKVNGATKRYVEYVTKLFDDLDAQRDAFFVDSGLTYDSPVDISGITAANPPVVTTGAAHGLVNGDTVILWDVVGLTSSGDSLVNGKTFTVANKTGTTFELQGKSFTGAAPYVSGGAVRKKVSIFGGLSHLEGETVAILADGAVQPSQVVSGGSISLSAAAGTVHAGLAYNSDAQMLRLEAGAADGTALGKTRRTHRVAFLLHRTLGLKIGMDFDDLTELTFRQTSDPYGEPPSLFSGIRPETVGANYDTENQLCWRQSQPLPGMILAVAPQMDTQDR